MTTNVRFNGMYFYGLFKQVSFAQLLLESVFMVSQPFDEADLTPECLKTRTHELLLDMTGNLDSDLP
jgi:hypothetical protein